LQVYTSQLPHNLYAQEIYNSVTRKAGISPLKMVGICTVY
jgi:hypothetical protein